MRDGKPTLDGDTELREVLNIVVDVTHPAAREDAIIAAHGDPEIVDFMLRNFLGTEPIEGWGYSYGMRLHGDGPGSLSATIARLRRNPYAKSATLSLLRPAEDQEHMPCICTLDFKLRDDRLHLDVFVRSEDVGKKLYADGVALGEILARAAKELGAAPGTLCFMIASAHIYEPDFGRIKELLAATAG